MNCDIWSVGVTLFVMYTGRPPYSRESRRDFWYNLLRNERYETFWSAVRKLSGQAYDDSFMDLINRMLCPDPKRRISIEEIISHPWMAKPTLSQVQLAEKLTHM